MLDDPEHRGWLAVALLVLVTVLTRGFFLLPGQQPRLPVWLRTCLRFAPLGALLAMVVPEVALNQGQWAPQWQDARWWACAAALLTYFGGRRNINHALFAGMGVLFGLHLTLGW